MNFRENFIRTITFNNPQWLHYDIHLNPAMWAVYKGELENIVLKYPSVFRGYEKGGVDYQNMEFSAEKLDDNYVTDAWGC